MLIYWYRWQCAGKFNVGSRYGSQLAYEGLHSPDTRYLVLSALRAMGQGKVPVALPPSAI
jgi:hypothetical protein